MPGSLKVNLRFLILKIQVIEIKKIRIFIIRFPVIIAKGKIESKKRLNNSIGLSILENFFKFIIIGCGGRI